MHPACCHLRSIFLGLHAAGCALTSFSALHDDVGACTPWPLGCAQHHHCRLQGLTFLQGLIGA